MPEVNTRHAHHKYASARAYSMHAHNCTNNALLYTGVESVPQTCRQMLHLELAGCEPATAKKKRIADGWPPYTAVGAHLLIKRNMRSSTPRAIRGHGQSWTCGFMYKKSKKAAPRAAAFSCGNVQLLCLLTCSGLAPRILLHDSARHRRICRRNEYSG